MKNAWMPVVLLVGTVLSGCASGLVGTLPDVKDRNDAAEIYIIRDYNYVSSGISAYVSFDNVDVVAIRTVQHTRFLTPTGNHMIGVRNPGFPINNVPVSLAPNSRHYFRVRVGFTNFSLVPLSEEESRSYISTTQYIDLYENKPTDKPAGK